MQRLVDANVRRKSLRTQLFRLWAELKHLNGCLQDMKTLVGAFGRHLAHVLRFERFGDKSETNDDIFDFIAIEGIEAHRK